LKYREDQIKESKLATTALRDVVTQIDTLSGKLAEMTVIMNTVATSSQGSLGAFQTSLETSLATVISNLHQSRQNDERQLAMQSLNQMQHDQILQGESFIMSVGLERFFQRSYSDDHWQTKTRELTKQHGLTVPAPAKHSGR
jgi:hypothetical protein